MCTIIGRSTLVSPLHCLVANDVTNTSCGLVEGYRDTPFKLVSMSFIHLDSCLIDSCICVLFKLLWPCYWNLYTKARSQLACVESVLNGR